jgi:hypothetical protein
LRSTRLLPLLALAALLGCDGSAEWLRGSATTTAYADPLVSDTTVVTTRRLWSWSRPNRPGFTFSEGTVMPNGAGIAGTDWLTGDPGVFDLTSKEVVRLPLNIEPYSTGMALTVVPSPDGSLLAANWLSVGTNTNELVIVGVTGGDSRTILPADTVVYVEPVAWTPAGDSVFALLYPSYPRVGDVALVLVPAAGGTPRRVHTIPQSAAPARMSLSSDGRWLLYTHERSRNGKIQSDIHIIDAQKGGARPLIEYPAVNQLVGWLPGTTIVLFSSDRSGTTDLWGVSVANGRASTAPRLVRSGFFRSHVVGFADGALFYRVETGSRGPALVAVDPQSGAIRGPISPPLSNLRGAWYRTSAWSPDGQALAAQNPGRGSRTINTHSIATGETRTFWLNEDVFTSRVEWAADGKALFLKVGTEPRGPHHFLHLDLVTGTTRRLFARDYPEESPSLWQFLPTPDGRSIVIRQQRTLSSGQTELTIVLRALEDGSERELHRTSGFIPEFSLSADGTQLAFMQQVWGSTDSLFILRMDGTQPPRYVASWVYDAVSLLGWLSAGNAMLAARLTEDATGEEILRIELDGSTTVAGFSPFRPQRGQKVQGYYRSRLILSPTGDRLVHEVIDNGEELWRMDGLQALFAEVALERR